MSFLGHSQSIAERYSRRPINDELARKITAWSEARRFILGLHGCWLSLAVCSGLWTELTYRNHVAHWERRNAFRRPRRRMSRLRSLDCLESFLSNKAFRPPLPAKYSDKNMPFVYFSIPASHHASSWEGDFIPVAWIKFPYVATMFSGLGMLTAGCLVTRVV